MKVQINNIYKNREGEFFTPAQSGDFYIVDMWECDKMGLVEDIDENPCPTPIATDELSFFAESNFNYAYPEPFEHFKF